jgi:uncharacterized protein YutE (UPF0331/DUF86 family)
MYYVNKEQIEQRLQFISLILTAIEDLKQIWNEDDLLNALAQERILHLAIESVTDVGSFMIDGLMMREASSYEDIIEVLHGEAVYSSDVRDVLLELVKLRRPLVQDYFSFERKKELHPILMKLSETLTEFTEKVCLYLVKELGDFETGPS